MRATLAQSVNIVLLQEEEAREEKKIEAESKKRGKLLHKLCGGCRRV